MGSVFYTMALLHNSLQLSPLHKRQLRPVTSSSFNSALLIPTLWGKSTWGLQTSLGRSNISIRSQLTSSLLETIRCTLSARARPGPSLSFFQTHILFPGPGMHPSITILCPFLLGSLRCLLKCHLLCCCRKKVHGTRNFDRLFKVCL